MPEPYASLAEYLQDLACLSERVRSGESVWDERIPREEVSGIFLPLASARRMLDLTKDEYALLALWTGAVVSGTVPSVREAFSAGCALLPEHPAFAALLTPDGSGVRPTDFTEDFLLGRTPRLPRGVRLDFSGSDAPVYHDADLADDLTAVLWAQEERPDAAPLIVSLSGEAGSGRAFILCAAAARVGRPILLAESGRPFSEAEKREIVSCALLCGALVCLRDYPGRAGLDAASLAGRLGTVLLTGESPADIPSGCAVFSRTLRGCGEDEQMKAVRGLLGSIPLETDPAEEPAVSRLGMRELRRLSGLLEGESLLGPVGSESLRRAAREAGRRSLPFAVLSIPAERGIGDLVLPRAQQEQFVRLCEAARVRRDVCREWGFERRLPYGRGMTVLFYGASGTGKTMAAGVLAHELGAELWHIDLTRLISKYIGETQKNIAAVFDGAKDRNCVLFFDEADALFARRGDVSDAQDRYANAEIASLLQQTERFDGITVLSTNLFQNFDEAFRRRITYLIRFPAPDAAARERLWRTAFPPETPCGVLDYAWLAQRFELTGAGIQSSALCAACLARSEGCAVGMAHVVRAVRNEFDKLGKSLDPQMIRQWGGEPI